MASQVAEAAPKWLAAGAIAAGCLAADVSTAHAEEGSVTLRAGGRAEGTIVLVLPNDRVVVRLADGTSMTFPWSDISLVQDGPRVYDAAGNMTTVAGQTQPTVTATSGTYAGPVNSAPAGDQQALMLEYQSLPHRGGTVALGVFGGLFMLNGVSNLIGGAVVGCGTSYSYSNDDCSVRNVMLGTGAATLALGSLMIAFTARRAHARHAGVDSLRARGLMIAENGEGPALRLSLDFSPSTPVTALRVVPSLTLRF